MSDPQLQSMTDQNWEEAKKYLADFGRLTKTGRPENDWDVKLIKKACALVVAEILLRSPQ